MTRTPGWFNRTTDTSLDPRTRELEIQTSCNQRRIAEIDRECLTLAADTKTRFRFGKTTIVRFTDPQTGEEEVLLLEAAKAVEFTQLQEEKACLQKHVEAIERELARLTSAVPTQKEPVPPRSPRQDPKATKLPWEMFDSPSQNQSPGPTHSIATPSQVASTEQAAGSGFGTFLAFLTAIGLTLLIL